MGMVARLDPREGRECGLGGLLCTLWTDAGSPNYAGPTTRQSMFALSEDNESCFVYQQTVFSSVQSTVAETRPFQAGDWPRACGTG